MKEYETLITDLDGTAVSLSSDGSDVKETTRLAIKRAYETGHKVACATGRSWELVKPVVQKLGIVMPCIIEGGTRIIDPITEETLWEKHLDRSAVARILAIFQQESSDGMLLTHAEELHEPLHSVTSAPKTARVMYLLGIDSEAATSICNQINQQNLAAAHPTLSWSGGKKLDVHVTHTEATKEHAIHVWLEMEKTTKAKTIGMGDSGNDIPLFLASGLKIAVGNATTELKQLADYIAPDQKDDALTHVINRFLLAN